HVDSAETVTEKVATILRSDGCIFVVIPIVDRQFAIGDFNALVHEHMYYFTLGGAVRLFENYGLEIASYHMRNDAGYFKLKRSMGGIRNNAIRYEFPLEHARMSFDIQLEKFINILKSDERILFYGATNGLNNLFHLSRQQIDIDYEKFRVTDSDPSKWDKYLSSHPLPILPSDRTADYKTICISALSFYDEIINRLDQDKVIISIGSL
ncbi:MAG TPA: hypothetical protein DHN29_19860, partial [Cytophagales bacterium]|nr:hypothetical protein [Cytophagales bacterium]